MGNLYDSRGTTVVAAAATLVANRLIGYDGNYAANSAPAKGISESPATTGDKITLYNAGTYLVEAGATIAVGNELTAGTDGVAVIATTGQFVHAIAVEAGAIGENIEVELTRYKK